MATERKDGEEVEPAGGKPVDHAASPRIIKLRRAAWFQLNLLYHQYNSAARYLSVKKMCIANRLWECGIRATSNEQRNLDERVAVRRCL